VYGPHLFAAEAVARGRDLEDDEERLRNEQVPGHVAG
jgi:hypothetical protein